jgi:hypothetical protein
MKSIINFFRNLFSVTPEEQVKIEGCNCEECTCPETKTYTPEPEEKLEAEQVIVEAPLEPITETVVKEELVQETIVKEPVVEKEKSPKKYYKKKGSQKKKEGDSKKSSKKSKDA